MANLENKPDTIDKSIDAEARALKAIARGQKALYRLAQYWLKHDKYDGVRFVAMMERHSEVFRLVKDEMSAMALVDPSDVAEANKIAGEPVGIE